MTYLDTNVVIRIITGDQPDKAEEALTVIQQGSRNSFVIIDAILVEICFVLEFHVYRMSRADIADALFALSSSPQVLISPTSKQAIEYYRSHPKLDYADCLLWALHTPTTDVMTFDMHLSTLLQTPTSR